MMFPWYFPGNFVDCFGPTRLCNVELAQDPILSQGFLLRYKPFPVMAGLWHCFSRILLGYWGSNRVLLKMCQGDEMNSYLVEHDSWMIYARNMVWAPWGAQRFRRFSTPPGVGLRLGWGSCYLRSSEVAHPRDARLGMGWGWGWVVVKHCCAEFTRKRDRARTAGTQQLDRQWHHGKKVCRANGQRLPKGRSESELSGNTSGVDSGVASMKETCSPASESCASTTEMKGRKKKCQWRQLGTQMKIHCKKTMNLNKITHLGRAVLRFCSSAYRSTWYILKNLAFSHNMSNTCDDADIEYRKQYSAPAGALTRNMAIFIRFPWLPERETHRTGMDWLRTSINHSYFPKHSHDFTYF